MSYDLHVHTTASDGRLSPDEVVRAACDRGLMGLAITDHDTLDGIAPACICANRCGLEIIPGVELASDTQGEVHILGLFIDPENPHLLELLHNLRFERQHRVERMVERLEMLGASVSIERIREIACGGSLGRPHVARALLEAGHVHSFSEAFEVYLGNGRPGYIPHTRLTQEEALSAIRLAGGLSFLAHPGKLTSLDLLGRLVPLGLTGLEVAHSDHTPLQTAHLRDVASRWGLLTTGGSDFHGGSAHLGVRLGDVVTSTTEMGRLREAVKALRQIPPEAEPVD